VEAARAKAERAAGRLVTTLMGELQRALGSGPPEAAVAVCADVAQRMTAEAAATEGVAVRRVALRVRNPANAPDDFERRALERWQAEGAPSAPLAEVVGAPGGGRELRYLRPIVFQPLCVTCHGAPGEIPAAVREAVAARYPEDRATGFRPGDLRGAVSARVPLP
jgi:hypothetical protein